jgi:putative radical SAM enzyme (TIGR03279 family)
VTRTPVNLYLDGDAPGGRHTEPAACAVSRGGLVDAVRPGSPAARAGIRPGARVLAANGRVLRDVVDYQFYTAEPEVALRVREPEGEERVYTFEKWPDDDLGLEFAEATWDGVRICTNTCFFCFLKGLPKGLRRTLYVKDDDYRLSFLHGNFVTLTNLTDADWERLAEQRLSPLHVSVHATEPELRRRMLGYPAAPDILDQLQRLGALRIRVHTQVVLCPGVNDGAHLDRTIADLGALYPTVQSIAVVPVGATMQFEERMARVHRAVDETHAADPTYARAVIRQISRWQRRLHAAHGAAVVHAADEFYLTAGARIPAARWYDGFPQYENGIGMTRALIDDWRRLRTHPPTLSLKGWGDPFCTSQTYSPFSGKGAGEVGLAVACGTLIAPVLARLFADFDARLGTRTRVVPVPNRHFGPRINVSGLLVAADVIAALAREAPGDVVVLPRTALDYFGRKFLDDGTPDDVARALGRPVVFASTLREVAEHLPRLARGIASPPQHRAVTNGIFWAS